MRQGLVSRFVAAIEDRRSAEAWSHVECEARAESDSKGWRRSRRPESGAGGARTAPQINYQTASFPRVGWRIDRWEG